MNLSQARELVGTIGQTSKMPGHSYGLPAWLCKTGSRLRQVEGTTCEGCYAMTGQYRIQNVRDALHRRFESLRLPEWVDAMALQIEASGDDYFRWHDSGDLQGAWHLDRIKAVAAATENVRHWLPTREYANVTESSAPTPSNLTIRLSGHKVNGAAPVGLGYPVSTVHTVNQEDAFRAAGAHICPAPTQGHKCLDCRACWDPSVAWVSYPIHSVSKTLRTRYERTEEQEAA